MTIGKGSESVDFSVAFNDDNIVEHRETFSINVPAYSGANVTGTNLVGLTGNQIISNDSATVSISSASATAGNDIIFQVTVSKAVEGALGFSYFTVPGSATAPTPSNVYPDFISTAGTKSFIVGATNPGMIDGPEMTVVITITTFNDADTDDEAFSIFIHSLTDSFDGQITIGTSSAIGTINPSP